jgi:hypothetical protein
MQAWESRCSVTSPSVLWKWKACSSGIVHRTQSKQSLWGQASVKLNPEICINNAASRLTAVGRQATATDSHSQTCLQTLFFLSPYLWRENNQITPACWKTYWNCIAFELGTLCGYFVCVCVCSYVLLYVSPLMRQLQNSIWGIISRIQCWGKDTKIIQTETSLHLNLEVVFYFLFFILFYFILFLYIFFLPFTYFLFLLLSLFFYFLFLILSLSL